MSDVTLPVLTDSEIGAVDGIRHGFFTRQGGVSEGIYTSFNVGHGSDDDTENVAENRRRATEYLGASALNSVYQVHGNTVINVREGWDREAAPEADAMITDRAGIALGILSADCAPILFCDPKSRVIGAAHAGWRGALSGVTEATLEGMIAMGAHRRSTIAVIGPTIGPDSYEVGDEFPEPFLQQDPKNRLFFRASSREGHFYFDLPGYLAKLLAAQGIAQVRWIGHDTCADEEQFFSYRRGCLKGETDYGRLLSAIVIEA
ncbi:MAG TPA: peptidoglycan editing factor PgeF [Rhodospirillaceae bacterium]|nr:polyphenol oxidase [Rhodospirillaceae bacterium]HAA91363.1 peptidoglycan editing factor PgeF [Rhodospirillaceae bacterium]HAT35944.1 peptidoglycan editing factor PgeF [Rhodospirillaceae bacterium]